MINKKIVLLLLIFSFIGTGCVKIKTNSTKNATTQTANLGGVFQTDNKGAVWKNKSLIANVQSKPLNFSEKDVYSIALDPSDNQTVYFGSASGMYASNDSSASWVDVKSLGKIPVLDIAVDNDNKCVLYIASGYKVMKTDDCARTWKQVYVDNETSVKVNAVAIDHFNTNNVYIGLSRGDVLRSVNKGESWQVATRVKTSIEKIVFDPIDSRKIFIVTSNKSLHRTLDGGLNWESLATQLKESKLGADLRDMRIVAKDDKSVIFLAAVYGLAKSEDLGETWAKIELLPPDSKARINSMVVNPINIDEIYFVTNTTFYKTIDGGVNWTPAKLPTARAGWKLLIDFKNPNIIYMGTKTIEKK